MQGVSWKVTSASWQSSCERKPGSKWYCGQGGLGPTVELREMVRLPHKGMRKPYYSFTSSHLCLGQGPEVGCNMHVGHFRICSRELCTQRRDNIAAGHTKALRREQRAP